MKDVVHQYQEMLLSISRFENGNVSESMNRLGLRYKVNFGLSIPVIDEMSSTYHSDNELASFLWNKQERESKLLALRLFDVNKSSTPQTELVINGIENIELAEQATQHFFIKLLNHAEIVDKLIKNENEFCKLAGLILISKIAQTDKNLDNVFFLNFLNQLKNIKLNHSVHQKRGLSRAFLQIGKRNIRLKEEVIKFIDTQYIENNGYKNWLEHEVKYYLNH